MSFIKQKRKMYPITPDMIDEVLVDRICISLPFQRGCITHVLAWLANSPIALTADMDEHLKDFIDDRPELIAEFQRIGYLQKEDPLPEEVKALLWNSSYSGYQTQNKTVIAAYKFGKESK